MNHQSMIDVALERAKARMGVSVTKQASAGEPMGLLKEAAEVADALEFAAITLADDGSPAGQARAGMVTDFFKDAAKAGPAAGATTTTGTQTQVPEGGKKKIQPGGSPSATNPETSTAPEGTMPPNILRQMPPATAPTPQDGKEANASLYDLLMQNKEAAAGGPLTMEADEQLPLLKGGAEGQAFANKLLGSNAAVVAATKREAKAPTRPRLAEVWGNAGDTQSDASGKAVWPQAHSKGDIKIASMARAFREERVKEAAEGKEPSTVDKAQGFVDKVMKGSGRERAAVLGALPFGSITSGAVGAEDGKGLQTSAGALAGRLAGRVAGAVPGVLSGVPGAGFTTQSLGAGAGGAAGAYLAHGKNKEKKAGLGDYSELFDTALNGDLGKEAQAFAQSIENA